ncbi:MAG: HAMP domain-containing sensor histidine kinase [Bacillota bacterium]|nr:HAMP domain-containing sensor histidine kinase [Bacillota bacterium]
MERITLILSDKYVRRQAASAALVLIAMALGAQLIAVRMTDSYKKALIRHDSAVAGYLVRNGADRSSVAAAFTSDESAADVKAGSSLLASAGYDLNTQNSLLPMVEGFHRKFAVLLLASSVLFSAALLALIYLGALRRDRQLASAAGKIQRFMDGDTAVRLDDCGEGSLMRLYAAVNLMATSLTAHIEKEKQNRLFLKETISDISHQLKTPLAALLMYNEIIQDEKTGSEAALSFNDKSRRELLRMESLVQNLLKLARLDAGTIELEKSDRSVRDFMEKCVGSFSTRAEREGKILSLECPDLLTLRLDETWLGEAVRNIIKNALDHTRPGNFVKISCVETAVATEIIISDNGAGIHPDDIHHIFKRFYRSRLSTDLPGLGIGLSLSMAVVEKHGGTITVRSEPGKGAEFRLVFPKLTNL